MNAAVLHADDTNGATPPPSVSPWLRLPDERWLVLAIIGLGLAIRLLFVVTHGLNRSDGEAEHVAIALATGRGFADAYFVGSGPTAHLTPYTAALGGLVYWLFGVQSPVSDAVMVTWSLGCFTASALLLNRLFRLLGAPAPARLAALAVMCCLPVFLRNETATFRFWEGQLAFSLLLLSLSRTVVEAIDLTPVRTPLHAAMPIAAAFLLNPIFGLVGGSGSPWFRQAGRRGGD